MANFKPKYVKKILISNHKLIKGIKKAADWATKKFRNDANPPIFLCVLKGALPFYANLITNVKCDLITDFIVVQSFKGKITRQTKPKIIVDIMVDVKNKDVIVCEDIIDSARTLTLLKKYLLQKGAKTVNMIVMLDKPKGRLTEFKPDYACFTFKNMPFIIGFGLDIFEKARNLPYIAEIDKKYIKNNIQ